MMNDDYAIKRDDLSDIEVIQLVSEHKASMLAVTPEESVHALDLEGLRQDNITFWTMWQDERLMGCGALKRLNESEAEVKSMRTHSDHLRKGVAKTMLAHILREARSHGYKRIYLETGSSDAFIPARKLYKKAGFNECGPYADYKEDENSTFMVMNL